MRTQTEQNERTLEEVAPGERGVILQVGNENGPVKRRLVDMGRLRAPRSRCAR